MHNPPHPGRIIKEAIEASPMSVTGFAAHIGVSRVALSRVLNERAGVTPEMSIKISEAFGQNSPDIWFNLQNDFDLVFCRIGHNESSATRDVPPAFSY